MLSHMKQSLGSYKKSYIAILLLCLLLVCLPIGLKYAVITWLENNGASQVSIKDIDLNLFTGALGIENFRIEENEKQKIRFSDLRLNCSMLSLLRKRILIESLSIQGLNLALEKDQKQLLMGLTIPLVSADNTQTDQTKPQETKAMPAFGVENFSITNATLAYHQTDLSTEMAVKQISLQDLYSWRAETPALIDIDTRVNGSPLVVKIQLNAFSKLKKARMSIRLNQLALAPFSALAAPTMENLQGHLNLENDLVVNIADSGQVQVEQSGIIDVVDLKGILTPVKDEDLIIEDLDIRWQGTSVIKLSADMLPVNIQLEGTLSNDHLSAGLSSPEAMLEHAGLQIPLSLTLDKPDDLGTLRAAASFHLQKLHLGQPTLGIDLIDLQDMRLESIEIQGLDKIHIAQLVTNELIAAKPDKTKYPNIKESLLQNRSVEIANIQFLDRSLIRVDSVNIHGTRASLYRNKEADLPLINLLKQVANPQKDIGHETNSMSLVDDEAPVQEMDSVAQNKGLGIQLNSLSFSGNNTIHVVDASLDPSFDRTIIIDACTIRNVDNRHVNNPADLFLALHVDKYAMLETKGIIQPFSPKVDLDLTGFIRNVHLPMISPYLSTYSGYIIQTGVLSLDYTCKADAGVLDVNNDITLKHIKLLPDDQDKIDQVSKQLTMPLDTALSILRDKNNDIMLSIPVTGDITNPDFNLNDVIGLALKKALTMTSVSVIKHLLQPYGAMVTIANLAKKGGEYLAEIKLDPIGFELGSADLGLQAIDYLKTIKNLLMEKEALRLTICGLSIPGDISGQTVEVNKEVFMGLADQRALAIQDFFVAQGIPIERLFVCNPAIDTEEDATPTASLSL